MENLDNSFCVEMEPPDTTGGLRYISNFFYLDRPLDCAATVFAY